MSLDGGAARIIQAAYLYLFMMAANAEQDEESMLPCCPILTEDTVIFHNFRCKHVHDGLMPAVLCFMGWAVLFAFSCPGCALPPRGEVFVLYSMLVASTAAGWLFSKIYLPPALAMMSVGMAYGNSDLFTPGETVSRELIVNARLAAITCVLIRAGLALNAGALKQYHWMIVRLGFLPMFSEMFTITLASYYVLDSSWLWSALLGSIICAASPAVAVHLILQLADSGYGIDKDIKTIAVAAISLDSVTAIVVIDLLLTFQYSHGAVEGIIMKGSLQILAGFFIGAAYGLFISFYPHKNYPGVYFFRILFLCSGAITFIIGSRKLKHDPAGYFACIISTFIASQLWHHLETNEDQNPTNDVMRLLWKFLQPVLFGLIGAEFNFELICKDTVAKAMIVLTAGMLVRLVVAFITSFGIDLTTKEKIFMTIAWIPKATVQAAFGPLVLDLMLHINASDEDKNTASTIAIISTLSVLVFGSIGTIGVTIGGRHLLKKSDVRISAPTSIFQYAGRQQFQEPQHPQQPISPSEERRESP